MVVKKYKLIIILVVITIVSVFLIMKKAPLDYKIVPTKLESKRSRPRLLNLPLSIQANKNFLDTCMLFNIDKDTVINIKAVGEGADYTINPYLFKSYENDGVEVYFDMKNEKYPFFDIHKDDRQYRFLWKSLKIDGQNINTKGVKITEKDPNDTSYIMQISFPWNSLGYITPKVGVKIGFDVALIDCDGGTRKALLTWHSTSEDSWKNTSFYGVLNLSNKNSPAKQSIVNCLFTVKKPGKKIDLDPIWRITKSYKFNNVTVGTVKDSLDLSGHFKTLWDNENLYLLVIVRDNYKTFAKAMFDYGWIENLKGKVIWKMDIQQSKPAGGALKNRLVDTIIKIQKGSYYLKYKTDESHSPTQWDSKPPRDPFYGIKVKYSK